MFIKHNLSKTKEYKIWTAMKQRCSNPNRSEWKYYGSLGIKVCDSWVNDFATFYKDMGPKPHPNSSIDRIDSKGNYEPRNCRWASPKEQANNRRQTHRYLTHNGITLSVNEWAKKLGINPGTLHCRIHDKWPLEKVLSGPVGSSRKPQRFK